MWVAMWLMQRGNPISAKALGSLSLPTLRPVSAQISQRDILAESVCSILVARGAQSLPDLSRATGLRFGRWKGLETFNPAPQLHSPLPNIPATHTPDTGLQNWGAHYLSSSDLSM